MAMARNVLCLDWDKRSLRLVLARVARGRMTLRDAHSHRLPPEVESDNPQSMGAFITQMLKLHRVRTGAAVVDVPRERAVINRMAMPPTPPNEVAAAVRFQAMRELPFSLESAALDYVVTRANDDGMVTEVLLAAVMNDTLNRIRETCAAAGLTPERIGLRPYANLVSARHVSDLSGRRVLMIDVGPGATEIDVFSGDAVLFARSANVNVPVPVHEAGAPEDSRIISLAEIATVENIDEAIAAAVDELLVEVNRTLQAYRATDPDVTIDGVIVAGGTGIEDDLVDALYERLGVPVETFDPTEPLGVEPSESDKLRSFSAALGLAWGMTRADWLALDFLNPKRSVSAREVVQRRVRRAGVLAGAALGLVAIALSAWYVMLHRELSALRAATSGLQQQVDDKLAIQRQVERARDWQTDAVWPDELLEISRVAVEPGQQMLAQSMELRGDRSEQSIRIRGLQVSDWETSNSFLAALNDQTLGGKTRYQAAPLGYTDGASAPFRGKLDIDVAMKDLERRMGDVLTRENERKRAK